MHLDKEWWAKECLLHVCFFELTYHLGMYLYMYSVYTTVLCLYPCIHTWTVGSLSPRPVTPLIGNGSGWGWIRGFRSMGYSVPLTLSDLGAYWTGSRWTMDMRLNICSLFHLISLLFSSLFFLLSSLSLTVLSFLSFAYRRVDLLLCSSTHSFLHWYRPTRPSSLFQSTTQYILRSIP